MYKRGDLVRFKYGVGKIVGFYPKTQDVLIEDENHTLHTVMQSSITKVDKDDVSRNKGR